MVMLFWFFNLAFTAALRFYQRAVFIQQSWNTVPGIKLLKTNDTSSYSLLFSIIYYYLSILVLSLKQRLPSF